MADQISQEVQEQYQIKVDKAVALAKLLSPEQISNLNKMVETQTNGLWNVESQEFRAVFDEWYKNFSETLDEQARGTIEGINQTNGVSRQTDEENLNEWDRIIQNNIKRRRDTLRKNEERVARFQKETAEEKTHEENEKAKKLLEQNELATKAALRESYLSGIRADTTKTLLDHKTDTNPDTFNIERGIKDARRIDAMNQAFSEHSYIDTKKESVFFQTLAEQESDQAKKDDAKKLDQQIDELNSEDKEAVKSDLFKQVFEKISNGSQRLTDKVGAETAQVIQSNLKTQLATTAELPSLQGPAKIVSDIGSSLFTNNIENEVVSFIELENSSGALLRPNGTQLLQTSATGAQATAGAESSVFVNGVFVTGKINSAALETAIVQSNTSFQLSLLAQGSGQVAASTLGTTGAGAAAGVAGKKAAGQFFGKLLGRLGVKAGTSAASATIGAGTGAAVGTGAGSVAGPLGAVGGFILGSLVEPATKVIKKGAESVFSGKFIPGAGNGIKAVSSYFGDSLPPAQKDGTSVVVILLILISVFVPVGTTLFQTTSYKGSALMAPVGSGPGGPIISGAPPGPRVIWSYTGDVPLGTIEKCPVSGGGISQGPYESFSHSNSKAYDLTNPMGAPIFASHDAYVVSFRDNLDPYTFENRSYGNYVLLAAKNSAGTMFFTMYAHLKTVNPIVVAAKNGTRAGSDPKLIRAGENIGTEDATGSTYGSGPGGTGVHLHFEYQGPGELVLPPGCP